MILKRCIAFAVALMVAVAGCLPAHADRSMRASGGKHVSRILQEALIFRNGNGRQKAGTGLRRGADKSWSAVTRDSLAPSSLGLPVKSLQPVDALPCHWAALHLKI